MSQEYALVYSFLVTVRCIEKPLGLSRNTVVVGEPVAGLN